MNDFYVCECAGDVHKLYGEDIEFDMLYVVRRELCEKYNYTYPDTVIVNKNCKYLGKRKHIVVASTKHLNLVHYTK